jgi:dTDP-4-amino-4,6-dideoxygalactose transaminase
VLEVLESGMLVQGPRTALLEERFAEVCGTKHAIAIANGTAALHTALLAHQIGPGDEVITTPFTFIASVNSIIYTGARPVFVDIDPDSFNLNPALIEAAITPRTKAIMPVHLYGNPCDMDAILDIAERHHLAVVEDAAQAVGGDYKGRPVGSFGTACFSLYATKNIMSGEGGMITTNDDAVAQRSRMIRSHGMQKRYYHDMLGYNFRLSDLHAAIGLAQLERLPDFTAKRRANAAFLNAHLTESVIIPATGAQAGHVWHQYTVRIRDGVSTKGVARDVAVEQLARAGVGTGIFYPVPANRQAHLQDMGLGDVHLPVAEQLALEVLSLPVHPQLTQDDLETIVREVNKL